MKTLLTPEQKSQIIPLYNKGMSCSQVAKELKMSAWSVTDCLTKNGISIRKQIEYSLNEKYFDDINTQEKAYFFGLLYADGCNTYDPKNSTYRIHINLRESDKEILEQLRVAIKLERPLRMLKKHSEKWSNQYDLRINNKYLSSKLNELGMVKGKTLTKQFPCCLEDNLIRHFIRGYFDGNGHLQNASKVGIYSTSMFINKLAEILKKSVGINSCVRMAYNKENLIHRSLEVSGRVQVQKFLEFIYKDSTVHIERKHKKYLEITAENLCRTWFNNNKYSLDNKYLSKMILGK